MIDSTNCDSLLSVSRRLFRRRARPLALTRAGEQLLPVLRGGFDAFGMAVASITDEIMLYCFLGGLDVVYGPVIGAFLLVISFELLHGVQEYQALIYGILMISCMLWLPNGIASFRPLAWKRGPSRRVLPTEASAPKPGR